MKKVKSRLRRFAACLLCLLMTASTLDIAVFAAATGSTSSEDETTTWTEGEGTGFYLAHANVDIFDEDYFPASADISVEEDYYRNLQAEIGEVPLVSVTRTTVGDPWVYGTQAWLIQEYGTLKPVSDMGTPDGITGSATVKALLAALQSELGVKVDGYWGDDTSAAYANNTLKLGSTGPKVAILQGALLCKGYNPGHYPTEQNDGTYTFQETFDASVETAVKELQADANISQTGEVSPNLMDAIMSMDSFKLLSSYGGKEEIREFQRYLNSTYESQIGLNPCDGVYNRNTNRAVLKVLQLEEKQTGKDIDGNWGDNTKKYCPEIPYVINSKAAKNADKTYYTEKEIERLTKLMQFVLFANGFGNGNFNGIFDTATSQALREFQQHHAIDVTGKADMRTWMSLLISCGDRDRPALGADCAMQVTDARAKTLYDAGYRYVGRYITGTTKKISREEAETILSNGLHFFPIYQTTANEIEYFTAEQGAEDAQAAIREATALGLPKDTIIYFAVDCDPTDSQITSRIIPYFERVNKILSSSIYKTGIYGTRNTCSRVSAKGYSCSSFVGDMSTGFSGNLGFKLPDDWAFDQFDNLEGSEAPGADKSEEARIEIDKNAVSGRDQGVSYLDDVSDSPSEEYNVNFGESKSDTVQGPTINILGHDVRLFELDMGLDLSAISGLIQTKYDHVKGEYEILIGRKMLGNSTEITGGTEEGEKFDQAYIEVKKLLSVMNNKTEFTRRFRDMKDSLSNKGTKFGFDLDTNFLLYCKINVTSGDIVEGGAALIGEASVSTAYPIPGLPFVYFKWELTGSVQAGITLRLDAPVLTPYIDTDFAGRLSLGAEVNLIAAKAYAGISGGLDCKFRYPAATFENFATVSLNASLFFEWNALLWGDRYDWVFANIKLYPPDSQTTALSISPNDMKFIEPLPQTTFASEPGSGVFRQNMQVYCLPQIISLGNGKMFMTYIEDESDTTKRISQNRTKLMYSIYDGSSWSNPQPVLDDGTVDFEPVIVPDGNGGAHILWQNGTTTFGSDVTMDEMAAGIDLYYTHWNGSTFNNTAAITSNNQNLETGYKIASSGNNLSVVWQVNTENDSFGLSGTNTIYRKQFTNGAWGNQETLASGLGIVNSIDTTYIGASNVAAYTTTGAGSTDVNDLELYYFNGTSTTRLTHNDTPDYSADFWNNELYWLSDNSIVSITNGSISTKTTVAENIGVNVPKIEVIGNNSGAKTIVWEQGTEEGLNFYGIQYNTATSSFGSVHPLSTTSGVVRGWDACMLPNGQVEMAYCLAEKYDEPVDDRAYGPLNLMQTSADSFYDVAVDTQAAYDGEIAGGQEITVYTNVYNTGSAPVNQFNVKITYNGSTVETLTVDQSLAVGESAELEIPFTLPSTISRRDYQVEILPVGGDDVSPADNITAFSIGFADLALEDISEVRTSSGRQLKVTVKNNGFSTSSAGTLELLRDGSEGSVYSSRTVHSLSPGASATYVFNIAQRDLDGDVSELLRTFYLSLESETEESDYGNNSEIVQMYPDYSISLTADTGGSVSGAGRYAYDSTATITATPQLGYMFDGWYEDGQRLHGLNATCELQVIASRTLEARFKPNNLSITDIEPYGVFDDEDNPMTFTAFTTGGQGALSYQFYVYRNGSQIDTISSPTHNYFAYPLSSSQTYSITVEVMDSTGYTVRGTTYYDGQNWYMDEYGDDFENAYNWRISNSGNDSIDGTFTSTNDVDVIKFTAPATGTYQIYPTGISTNYLFLVSQSVNNVEPINTKLSLYDSSYNLCTKTLDFYNLTAGRVYYIKFENPKQLFAGAYNSYTINVSRSTEAYYNIVSNEYPLVFQDGRLLSTGAINDYNSYVFKVQNVGNGYYTISADKETIYSDGNYHLVDLPEPLYLTYPGDDSNNPYGPNVAGLVYMRSYTGDLTQKWTIQGNGDYIHPASNTSHCFALNTQMPRPFAANIVRFASSNDAHFSFARVDVSTVQNGNYRIINAGSGLYLGATDTDVTQNWAGDIWNVQQQDNGYYVISSNARSAQVLTYNETTGKVESATDTADESQRWAITRGADGTIRLSPQSDIGNIMAVENASADASAAIVLQEDGFAANGKWIVEDITSTPTEESGIIPDGVYEIQDITSGKLIQAESGGLGAVAHLWESADTDNQKLDFAYQSDGTYKITVLSSDNVLTVPASSSNNGVQLQFYAWNGGDHQRWYVVDIGGGFFKLINKYSGLVVDISENGTVNGTKIQQWQDTGAPAQMFRLLPDDPVTSMELNDGVYELQGKTSGKLIHSASGAPGSIAHLWEDANTDNQRLRFERQDDDTYKITVLSSGSVLTARDAGAGNGVQLDFSAWTDGDHQKWYVVDCGGGYVKLINKHSGLAIDISENGTANGTKVQQWEDTGADAQRFRLLPTTLPSVSMDLDNGLYQIQGKTSGKLIDAAGWSNGTVAHLWESAGTTNQKMNFERQSDGTYKITVYDGEKALTDPNSYSNGAQLLFWDWNGSDQQKWYVVDCGNGYVKFINKFSGQAIDISENGTENGTKIQQWQDTGADAQRFHLIPVSN